MLAMIAVAVRNADDEGVCDDRPFPLPLPLNLLLTNLRARLTGFPTYFLHAALALV